VVVDGVVDVVVDGDGDVNDEAEGDVDATDDRPKPVHHDTTRDPPQAPPTTTSASTAALATMPCQRSPRRRVATGNDVRCLGGGSTLGGSTSPLRPSHTARSLAQTRQLSP
jgi:hypothetical protein